jgi:hypothetical protein
MGLRPAKSHEKLGIIAAFSTLTGREIGMAAT